MDVYSLIQIHIVDQMTPVITLTSIETIAGTPVKYKLFSCNTQWVTINDKITIDGVVYRVVSFVQDEYLIVTGASAPVQLYFQLPAPTFEHGTHRRVSTERVKKSASKRTITPMIYALPIKGKTRPSIDSMFGFSGKVRFFCLTTFDKNGDSTIATQQKNIVNPMSALVRYFIQKFEERLDLFEEIKEVFQDDFMDFGDPTIWGAKERIFEEFLSGVGVNFDLNIYSQDECCTDTPAVSCLPVKLKIEGVLAETLPSGDTFNLNLIDTDGNVPTHTYNPATDTLEVPAPGGGGSADIQINAVPVLSGQTGTVNIPVVASDGATTVGNWNIFSQKQVVSDSVVNVKDSAGAILHVVSVLAEATANQTVSDVTQTLNGSAITNNKAQTSKAITIRYANNDPVVVTTITDTETVFVGEVPDVRNVATTWKDGQTTSYITGDAGAQEIGAGVAFLTLDSANYFGNTDRYTDELGGQTYTKNYVCDWSQENQVAGTVRVWYRTPTSAVISTALAAAPYTLSGLSGWYIPNYKQLADIERAEDPAQMLNYAPFNIATGSIATSIMVTNTITALQGLRRGSTFPLQTISVASTCRYILYRDCTYAELANL